MQANKNGFYYVLDRVTGKVHLGAAVRSSQLGERPRSRRPGGRSSIPKRTTANDEAITISRHGGAHNWSPMSFNPATVLVYIPTTPSSNRTFLVEANFTFQEGRMNTGVPRGGRGGAAAENPRVPSSIGPTAVEGQRGGILLAWDPITQKERWRTSGGGGAGGGTLTTAGNLVIQVINDGRLFAYTADKGEKLFDIQTGLRGGMGPPITYSLDGKQYIALMGGSGQPVRPKLLAFVLDGKEPLPQ